MQGRSRASLTIVALACCILSADASAQTVSDTLAIARLRALVLAASPELAARRAAVDAANARLRATGFAPPAAINAEIEEIPDGLDVGRAGSTRVEVSRELLPGALREARRALARADVQRSVAELELAERRLAARVNQELTRTAAATAIARRLAAEDSLLSAAEGALRVRFAEGSARYVDVLRLRTERLRVQSDMASAVTEARIGRRTLLSLGASSDSTASAIAQLVDSLAAYGVITPPVEQWPMLPPADSLVAIAGATRLAAIEVARAERGVRLARAERRPTVVASLGAQRFESDGGGYTVGPTLAASISLPFTAGRANRAAAQAAEGELVVARARERAATAAVRAEVSAALDRYDAARTRLMLFDAALLRGARDEREGALAAYRGGDLSLVELLDFERALARAEIERLRSRIDAADALADVVAGVVGVAEGNSASAVRPGDDR